MQVEQELPPNGERLITAFGGAIASEHLHRYALGENYTCGKDVLDIACGEGYGAYLISKTARSVVGVDISPETISHATNKYQNHNLSFKEGSCYCIPAPNSSADVILSFETLEHIDEHDRFMQEITRVLRPGGTLVISSPDKLIYSDLPKYHNPFHKRELYHEEFRKLLGRYFTNVYLGKQSHHSGTAILFESASAGQPYHYQGDYNATNRDSFINTGTYSIGIASNQLIRAVNSIFSPSEKLRYSRGPEIAVTAEIISSNDATINSETLYLTPGLVQSLRFFLHNPCTPTTPYRIKFHPTDRLSYIKILEIGLIDSDGQDIITWPGEDIAESFAYGNTIHPTHTPTEWLANPGGCNIESPQITPTGHSITVELKILIELDAWQIRFHRTVFDYKNELMRIGTELQTQNDISQKKTELLMLKESEINNQKKHLQEIQDQHIQTQRKMEAEKNNRLLQLECIINKRLEREFRQRYLRPKNPLRKFSTRRLHFIERLLPAPRLGIDECISLTDQPNRADILRRALELKIFNCAAYLAETPEIWMNGAHPFIHYLVNNWPKGVIPKESPLIGEYLDASFASATPHRNPIDTVKPPALARPETPLVSIIIVSINGKSHFPDLFESIAKQTYPHHETILVDNGSNDGSIDLVSQRWPWVRIVNAGSNTGFAEGNNIGAEIAKGNLLCLLNNDTQVDERWLHELVDAWKKYPMAAAVCSKVLFWKPFIELTVSRLSPEKDLHVLLNQIEEFNPGYRKIILKTSHDKMEDNGLVWINVKQKLQAYLPYQNQDKLDLKFRNLSPDKISINITISDRHKSIHQIPPGEHIVTLSLNQHSIDHKHVINNAGSNLNHQTLEVGDRGIFEFDRGQYETTQSVDAICGCSALVDPIALNGIPLFCSDFFAYFEDTDLSLRIRKSGYEMIYAPKSVVYHKHASSSREDSAFFRYQVYRNRIYLAMLHMPATSRETTFKAAALDLRHLEEYYLGHARTSTEKDFASRIPQLLSDINAFKEKCEKGEAYIRARRFPAIGVYNTYWNTRGGGEHHALMFATYFSRIGLVDLISEVDFDLDKLGNQFGINIKNCRKKIAPSLTSEKTAEYELFINSTFCSSLISKAKRSYYIISFPHIIDPKNSHYSKFLESYTFLANSLYTKKWTQKYWGLKAEVVYPSIENTRFPIKKKDRYILNVGRFFTGGHNKKQMEIAEIFHELKSSKLIPSNWHLILAGKIQPGSEHYKEEIQTKFGSSGVQIHADVSLTELNELYDRSLIYWHATGLDEDPKTNPEKFEHFGISSCEALAHRCIPIVYNCGGQPEIIDHQKNGFLFNDRSELIQITAHIISQWETNPDLIDYLQNSAMQKAASFDRAAFNRRLDSVHPLSAQRPLLM